jgi:hypothetical protein
MKKHIIAAVLISGLAMSTVASANWGRGGGNGYNCGNCPQAQYMQQLDPAVQEKIDAFFDETAGMRKEIAVKQAEKMTLLRGTNPDAATVARLTGELFDLHAAMRDKAEAAGVDQYIGPMGGGRGAGKGMGFNGGGRGGCMMQGGPRF